jgi:hypothetical protein
MLHHKYSNHVYFEMQRYSNESKNGDGSPTNEAAGAAPEHVGGCQGKEDQLGHGSDVSIVVLGAALEQEPVRLVLLQEIVQLRGAGRGLFLSLRVSLPRACS